MNKRSLLPVLSTALLAPAFLAGQVYAEEATTPAESSAVVATPATSATPAPVESPAVPETSSTSEAVVPTEAPSAPAESPKSEEKDTVILHTNDVHGRIVEEKGVIGDAKLATVIEQERAKSNQNTLVVDAGDAFQGLPISNSTKGEARAEILNQMQYDAMAVGNHEFDFGLDEAKKYKEILKFPLLSSNTYVNGARLFEASTIVDKDKTVEGDEFDPNIIIKYDDKKIEDLLKNEGVIRNKLKINAVITNAKEYFKLCEEFGSLDKYLWAYVDNKPIKNSWTKIEEVPARTELSDKISKDLKKRGFKFVGSTIIYAFMQAVGMVNDHLVTCSFYNKAEEKK